MTAMTAKKRIAILGGGISSLSAAWHLTRSEALRERFDVTVYQMGWRLGGKLASGFEQSRGLRNVEHGLHVWFGWYENAFRLFQDLIAEWHERGLAPEGTPVRTWSDAFSACNFTPLGQTLGGKATRWDFTWGANAGVPGQSTVLPGPKEIVTGIIGWIEALILDWLEIPDDGDGLRATLKTGAASAAMEIPKRLAEALHDLPECWEWLELTALGAALAASHALLHGLLKHPDHHEDDVDAHFVRNCVDVGHAVLRGLLNPEYGLRESGWDLDRLDGLELRQWLIDNGADERIVREWTVLRMLYDAMFEYESGDRGKPNYAAGTAARVMIRMGLTYRGAALYLLNAGMGAAVIGPLYEVLRARGVRFEFFSKVEMIHVQDDGAAVDAVSLVRQAEAKGGSYEPVVAVRGIPSWPAQPFWEQLEGGEKMAAEGVDFESHWGPAPAGRPFRIERGRDFDDVVLGMALGAWKRLGDQLDPGEELRAASPALAAMAEALPLTPSGGIQLWCDRTTQGLGFSDARRAAGLSLFYPMDVWADMTPALGFEDWGLDGPASVQYLCGVFDTELYKQPPSATDTPARAKELLFRQTRQMLERDGGVVWPAARKAEGFDWQVLHAGGGAEGDERLRQQWIRANVDPTECCVASPAGGTAVKLRADETGLSNLWLVGECAYTGVNSTTVENGVMSGMQAARAISGDPLVVVGEDFLAGRWRT